MANGYVPPEVASLMGLFDTHIRWKQTIDRKHRSYINYHPSELGKCLRHAQYRAFVEKGLITVEQEDIPSEKQRLFDQGHNMHARWARYAESMGILRGCWRCSNPMCSFFDNDGKMIADLTPEQKEENLSNHKSRRVFGRDNINGIFKPTVCQCSCKDFDYEEVLVKNNELMLEGHADMILDFSGLDLKRYEGMRQTFNLDVLPKKPIVVDMKTCNSFGFDKVLNGNLSLAYKIQLSIYANILDVEYGVIIYECKDNSKTASFKIEKKPEVWEVIKTQMMTLQDLFKEKRLPPPRPASKSDYECKNCMFSSLCHKSKCWSDPDLEKNRKEFYQDSILNF